METFMVAAGVGWTALALYVGWLALRQRRLAARYEALQKQLQSGERGVGIIDRAA